MKKARSIVAFLMAAAMLAATACSQSGGESSSQGSSAAEGSSAASEASQGGDGETHDIVYWDMAWGGEDYVKAMENQLQTELKEAVPGVGNIEYVSLTWDNFLQVHLTAINSGTAPDIFTAGFGTGEVFARMGAVHYLDKIDANEELKAKYDEATWNARRYEGNMVQIPWMRGVTTLFYRTDMFAEVGYTESPKTWDEFMDALRKVKAEYNIDPFIFDLAGNQSNHLLLLSLLNNGVGCCKYDANNNVVPAMSDPENKRMIQYLVDMYQEGLVPQSLSTYKRSDLMKVYLDGQAAVFIGDLALDVVGTELEEVTGVLDVLTGPDSDEQRALTFYNGLGVFAQSECPELCEDVIAYLVNNTDQYFVDGMWEAWPADKETTELVVENSSNPFYEKGAKNIEFCTPAIYPIEEVYDGWGVIDGEALLGKVAQMAMTGASSDVDEIAAYGDQLIQDAIDSQKEAQ